MDNKEILFPYNKLLLINKNLMNINKISLL